MYPEHVAPPVVALLLLALVTGCGGQDGNGTPAGSATAVAGPVAGVPLPDGARLVESEAPRPDALLQTFHVEGMSTEELQAWYDERLPRGEGWGEWAWCEEEVRGSRIHRNYHRPGSERILGVTVAGGNPPSVILGEDGSGPC